MTAGTERSQHYLLDREVEIGIVEDHGGVLAAHLALRRHPAGRRCGGDTPPDTGRAGEGYRVDAGVVDDAVAQVGTADQQVEHPGG